MQRCTALTQAVLSASLSASRVFELKSQCHMENRSRYSLRARRLHNGAKELAKMHPF